jgi:hypothetical protein
LIEQQSRLFEQLKKTGSKIPITRLAEVFREEGIDAVRYALWDATVWYGDRAPPAWHTQATEEQKRIGWEMAVRIE